MEGVARLPPDHRGRVRRSLPIALPRKQEPDRAVESSENEHDEGFAAPGVNRRELRRLKRGAYPPGRRLDLHGMTAVAAVAAARAMIEGARGLHRCVAIVHGRGLHSPGSQPVLRARVREDLRRNGAVLAFTNAPPNDGGTGAVYVLLRGR
jgi:DNA-nicking Smr family endonuclease